MNITPLMLVTNKQNEDSEIYCNVIQLCVEAGLSSVQIRQKHMPYAALVDFSKKIKNILDPFAVPLIINDNVDVCLAVDAAGVHLGQADGDILSARQALGKGKIIGLSVNSMEEVIQANSLPIQYIGVGAIFPTKNKKNIAKVWGVNGLAEAAQISRHPIVAIGGINTDNIHAIRNNGATGIAAIGAFHDATNPYNTTKQLLNAFA